MKAFSLFQKSVFVLLFCALTCTTHAKNLSSLTLILDWFANPTDGPILVAQEEHFFRQLGLKVTIINPADPNDTTKLVAIGKADIGVGSDPNLVLSVDHGLPLLRVGSIFNQPMVAIVSYNTPTLRDLKGKTIGYPVGDLDKFILTVMLQHVGLSLNDVNLVDVHFNLVQALLSKRVDAITGAMRDYEVPQIRASGMKISSFYPEDYGLPKYAELNYIINRAHRNDPRIKRFLTAIQLATQYLQQHPQAAWKGIVAQYPQLNTPLNRTSWKMSYPLFAKEPAASNKKNIMQLATLMRKEGWIKHVQPYHNYVA